MFDNFKSEDGINKLNSVKISELLRSRWEQIRQWYSKSDQKFLDNMLFSVLSENEKLEILRNRFVNEK